YGGTNLTLNYPPSGTSTFGVNVTAGTSNVLHIYRVNSSPNDVTLPSQMSNFDTRYFGIFTGTDNITYDAIYTYTDNTAPNPPLNASPTALAVARRDRNNSGAFAFQTGTVNTGTTTHTVTGLTMDLSAATPRNQQEFIYGSISDPVLANIEGMAIAYSEGAGNPTTNPTVQITNNITVTYGGNLTSATVSISGGFAEDLLEFTAIMGNPVTFGSFAGGVLTLTGSATAAQYQAALRAVTYRNTSDAPNTTARTVTFRVIDGMKQSNTQQRTINITAVNDAPALSMQTCSGNTFTEDGAAVVILTGITVADPDNTSLNTASVTITNVQASDLLSFTTIMGNPVTSAGYNAATGLLNLNVNGASHAQLAAALQAVTFSNSSQNPNTTARTIRFVVRDASLNSGNIDCTINVNSVNDKPVIAPTTSTITYNKLSTAINVASSATVSDIDNTTLTALTLNIGNYNAGEDVITFTCPMGVTCPAVGATMNFTGTVTLANYQALIRSFTYRNSSGTPMGTNRTFTFVANDGQAANNLSDAAVFTVNVNANFNIAPTLDAGCPTMTANFNENQSPLAILPNPLTITDLDNTNLSKAEFKITTGYRSGEDELLYDDDVIPLPGTLTATWNATTGTLSIEGVETIAGYLNILARIKYKNESEKPTAGNRTITAQFFDNGFPDGTLGNIRTTNICTLRINVIPSNDPPVLDNLEANISYTEDEAAKALTALITVEDKDNDNMANATISIISNYFPDQDVLEFANQLGITGAWNATTGILTLTGASSKANYQTALRNVKYKNTSQRPSNSIREVSFKVNDGQADSNIPTINLTVIPVNDSPVLANVETNKLGYTEGEVAKIITSTITVTDVDDDNIESATITISGGFAEDILSFTPIMGNPVSLGSFVSGVLTLTGTATKAQYEAALRNVKYNNISNQPNIGDRTVSFKINDGDIDSNIPTRIISVGGVNNKPVINYTPTIQTYTEGEIPTNKVIFPLPANFTIVDLDNTNLVRATITISGNYFSEDVLAFTNQNGITGSWNAGSGVLTLTGSASVANYITAIRSITYANTSENPSNLQRTLTIIVNDGIENSDAVNQLINVLPVNDLPTVINIQRATNINGQVKIERVHFLNAYGDIENDALQKIAITSLPINGQLLLNNVPVVINQQIAGSDFVLNYIPNKNFTGDDFFEWKAADRNTATNIATEYSAIPARVNIQIGLPDLYPPNKLKAQAGSKQILLSWEPVVIEGLEISYEVYLFAPNQPQRLIEVTKENKLLIKGLDNTVTYVLRVQAVDNIGRNSGLSDPVSARPSIVLGTEDDLSDLQLNLYPNPNMGDFIIQFVEKNNKRAKLFIINTLGQKVFEKELQSSSGNYEEKIEANLLSEGAYILQISTDKNTYQRRFLIQK
ncbi:MAG: T9SS type A sorting domain-containing protein, partial [Thermoflexibacter sp.]|nr:T9SS type A sorting domain-containing protein [Thermoflexibacter sp.]